MRKIALAFAFFWMCAIATRAQGGFTTVTGTITDPNNIAYACGSISAQLVTSGGPGATLNGGGFTTQTSPVSLGCSTSPGTGAAGSFAMRLADSGVINPSNTTWKFTVNMTPGIAPPEGTGPQSFSFTTAINCSTNTPSTCTSNTMDISTPLSLIALRLSNAPGAATFPPPNTGATTLTYKTSNNTFHFTRTDGVFSNMVIFDNSADPCFAQGSNDFTGIASNSDGQTNFETFHNAGSCGTPSYIVSSLLDLDQDSHFVLGAGTATGIGSSPTTFDTCIPTNITVGADGCSIANALHINTGGTIIKYQGLTLGGNGIIGLGTPTDGSASGTVTSFVAWTTPATGYGAAAFYEVSWVGTVSSAGAGETATATWNFTDETGANSCTSGSVPFGATHVRIDLTCRFFSAANTQVKLTVTTSTGTTPTYTSHIRINIH